MSRPDDRGVAAAFVLMTVTLLVVAGGAGVALSAAVFDHARAGIAADAAALAAAGAATAGEGVACAAAARVTAADGARLTRCSVRGAVADVSVRAATPAWLAWAGAATLNARAGPADITDATGAT